MYCFINYNENQSKMYSTLFRVNTAVFRLAEVMIQLNYSIFCWLLDNHFVFSIECQKENKRSIVDLMLIQQDEEIKPSDGSMFMFNRSYRSVHFIHFLLLLSVSCRRAVLS